MLLTHLDYNVPNKRASYESANTGNSKVDCLAFVRLLSVQFEYAQNWIGNSGRFTTHRDNQLLLSPRI